MAISGLLKFKNLSQPVVKTDKSNVAAESRQLIAEDFAAGEVFGKDIIGDKALGRLTGGQTEADIVRQRRLDALQGFNAPELAAARDKATTQIDRASEGALRRLKASQAASGVRGATASTQQAGLLQDSVEQKANFERELLIQNRGEQKEALDALQTNVQFDLDAQSREKFAQLATGLGFAQIGSTERAAEASKQAQLAAARSSGGCFTGDTLIDTPQGPTPIKDLQMGDLTNGGFVYSVHVFYCDGYHIYNGIKVGPAHAVLHEGKWQRIGDIEGLEFVEGAVVLYDIGTTDHRIFIEGIEFADYHEIDEFEVYDQDAINRLNNVA